MLRLTKNVSLDSNLNKISNGDNIFPITEKEKQLLLALWEYAQEGSVLSREQLIQLVWPERKNGVEESNLLQLVCKLRRTLRYCELGEAIHTVYRQGYRFILPKEDDEQIEADDSSSEDSELSPRALTRKAIQTILYPASCHFHHAELLRYICLPAIRIFHRSAPSC